MTVKPLTKHHLEFFSLKGGFTGSSESSTLIKMPHCWKSHVVAQMAISHNKSEVYLTVSVKPFAYRVILNAFLSFADCFQNHCLRKILSEIPSRCQTVWMQISSDLEINCLQRLSADDSS